MPAAFRPAVGDAVLVKAWKRRWYRAKVVASRGKAPDIELRIHVSPFDARHDLWLPQASRDLRRPGKGANSNKLLARANYKSTTGYVEEEDKWELEKAIRKKKIKGKWHWLMRWRGWAAEHDTWEPRRADTRDVIEEYEEQQKQPAPAAKRAVVPRAPAEPYTTSINDEASAAFTLREISRQLVAELRKASTRPGTNVQVARVPAPPWAYRGVHSLLRGMATGDKAERDAQVTPIQAAPDSRGERAIDVFYIDDTQVLERAMRAANEDDCGEGSTYLRLKEPRNALALLPRVAVFFRGKRGLTGAAAERAAEVIDVRAEIGQLVAAGAGNQEPYFDFAVNPKDKTGKTALYDEPTQEQYSLTMAEALLRLEERVGASTVPQLPWLRQQAFVE